MATELIRAALTKDVDRGEFEKIRALWKKHSIAEDQRDLPGLMSTLSLDCEYEIVGTQLKWVGHEGATQFYSTLLTAVPDIKFHLTHIVIGPQGVFEEARVTGIFKKELWGYAPTLRELNFKVGILFPWNEKEEKFSGERIFGDIEKALRG